MAGLPVFSFSDEFLPDVPVAVAGVATTEILPGSSPHDARIALDGAGVTSVGYSLSSKSFSFDVGSLSFSGTVKFGFEVVYEADFHLETVAPRVIVPELTNMALLATGGLLLSAGVRRGG